MNQQNESGRRNGIEGGVSPVEVWPVRNNGELVLAPLIVGDEDATIEIEDAATFTEIAVARNLPAEPVQRFTQKSRLVRMKLGSIAGTRRIYARRGSAILWSDPQVNSFMHSNLEMPQILHEARSKIAETFGKVKTRLEIEQNYNGRNDTKLWVYIASPYSSEETLSRFEEFEQNWLLPQLHRFSKKLNFNLEFTDGL